MKHEYRKHESQIYGVKATPTLDEIKAQKYLCLKGSGNPNHEDFTKRVAVLYGVSYAIKMMPKKGMVPNGYFEYTVYPLEGLGDLSEKGRHKDILDKDDLVYTLMIRQPEFVSQEVVEQAIKNVRNKNDNKLLDEVSLEEIEDGLSVSMLHLGPYDDEPATFSTMKAFIEQNHLEIKTLVHREIYLSDARKVTQDKLKTILRYQVIRVDESK